MAVYTDVGFEELEGLLAGYEIGVPLAFKGIAEGVENSNFYLQTDRGAFILTLYEKRVLTSDLPFFLGLMEHLAGAWTFLSPAGEEPRRRAILYLQGPSRRDPHLSDRRLAAQARYRALRRGWPGLGRAA